METFRIPEKFQRMMEAHHQSLYRYYALHAEGDLQLAYELTKETFLVLYCKYASFEKDGFRSEVFGIAWDVWNAHYSRKAAKTNLSKSRLEASVPPQLLQMLHILRRLPFYPREIFYLRFFAGLDTKDIACLMDKNDTAVKVLVYQTLMQLASCMNGIHQETLPWKQLLILAQAYHRYLNEMLAGTKPRQSIMQDALVVTGQLRTLREAMSMTPEAFSCLLQEVKDGIRQVHAFVTLL